MLLLVLLVGDALACSSDSLVPSESLLNQHFVPCADCVYPIALPSTPGRYEATSLAVAPGEYDYALCWLTAAEWAVSLSVAFVAPCSGESAWSSNCWDISAGAPYNPSYADSCTFYATNESSGTFTAPTWQGAQQPFWVQISASVHNQSLPVQLDFCLGAAPPPFNAWYIVGFVALGVVCLVLLAVVLWLCCCKSSETEQPLKGKTVN